MAPRGTYRVADERPVEYSVAQAAWAVAARPALIKVARRYNMTTSYKELSEIVQDAAGIRTTQMMHYWIGGVLEQVALGCHERGEPILTALCVDSTGSVGAGYAHAIKDTYGFMPEDLDMHAAEERLKCYRFFGAELPPDGGRPALTKQVAERRKHAKKAKAADKGRPICPTCHLQLPATGRCDNCSTS